MKKLNFFEKQLSRQQIKNKKNQTNINLSYDKFLKIKKLIKGEKYD